MGYTLIFSECQLWNCVQRKCIELQAWNKKLQLLIQRLWRSLSFSNKRQVQTKKETRFLCFKIADRGVMRAVCHSHGCSARCRSVVRIDNRDMTLGYCSLKSLETNAGSTYFLGSRLFIKASTFPKWNLSREFLSLILLEWSIAEFLTRMNYAKL